MKIMIVCLGNICRSPLAEGVLRQLAQQNNLNWEIASAGTGSWHVGDPADRRSIAVAEHYGYDISEQRARHFDSTMLDEYDHIFVMDKNNLRDVLRLATTTEQRKKVSLFLTDEQELPDPYYDDRLFDRVFHMVEDRAKNLITELNPK